MAVSKNSPPRISTTKAILLTLSDDWAHNSVPGTAQVSILVLIRIAFWFSSRFVRKHKVLEVPQARSNHCVLEHFEQLLSNKKQNKASLWSKQAGVVGELGRERNFEEKSRPARTQRDTIAQEGWVEHPQWYIYALFPVGSENVGPSASCTNFHESTYTGECFYAFFIEVFDATMGSKPEIRIEYIIVYHFYEDQITMTWLCTLESFEIGEKLKNMFFFKDKRVDHLKFVWQYVNMICYANATHLTHWDDRVGERCLKNLQIYDRPHPELISLLWSPFSRHVSEMTVSSLTLYQNRVNKELQKSPYSASMDTSRMGCLRRTRKVIVRTRFYLYHCLTIALLPLASVKS